VFFGGGTPSLLDPDALAVLLAAIPRAEGAEVTVECNPETVDPAKLAGYRDAGVNRLSFGVQSMVPRVLAGLGRRHDPDAVLAAVAAAGHAGFGARYSVDLIMGGAGETAEDWAATVESALDLDPAPRHISAYGLTVEAGTPLAADVSRHPDPDDQADKYMYADQRLAQAGMHWYEISNWARPGSECHHNQLYWRQGEYLGIGCAAHSHLVDPGTGWARRWWNVRTPDRYIRLVEDGQPVQAAGEDLDPDTRRAECRELEIRTAGGVDEGALPGWAEDPVLAGLVEPAAPGRLRLTARGRLLANEVAIRLS
jgi:oxygen-independent coproporphyrinogen-3 oxidase